MPVSPLVSARQDTSPTQTARMPVQAQSWQTTLDTLSLTTADPPYQTVAEVVPGTPDDAVQASGTQAPATTSKPKAGPEGNALDSQDADTLAPSVHLDVSASNAPAQVDETPVSLPVNSTLQAVSARNTLSITHVSDTDPSTSDSPVPAPTNNHAVAATNLDAATQDTKKHPAPNPSQTAQANINLSSEAASMIPQSAQQMTTSSSGKTSSTDASLSTPISNSAALGSTPRTPTKALASAGSTQVTTDKLASVTQVPGSLPASSPTATSTTQSSLQAITALAQPSISASLATSPSATASGANTTRATVNSTTTKALASAGSAQVTTDQLASVTKMPGSLPASSPTATSTTQSSLQAITALAQPSISASLATSPSATASGANVAPATATSRDNTQQATTEKTTLQTTSAVLPTSDTSTAGHSVLVQTTSGISNNGSTVSGAQATVATNAENTGVSAAPPAKAAPLRPATTTPTAAIQAVQAAQIPPTQSASMPTPAPSALAAKPVTAKDHIVSTTPSTSEAVAAHTLNLSQLAFNNSDFAQNTDSLKKSADNAQNAQTFGGIIGTGHITTATMIDKIDKAAPLSSPSGPDSINTAPAALSAAITALHQAGQNAVTLRLDPPELGHLSIQVKIDPQGAVNVLFIPSTSEAAQALQGSLPQLGNAMAQSGLVLGQAGVGGQFSQSGGQGSQQSFYTPQRQASPVSSNTPPDTPKLSGLSAYA